MRPTRPRLFGYFSDNEQDTPVLFIKYEHSFWHIGQTLEDYGNVTPTGAIDLGEIVAANDFGIIVNGEIVNLALNICWQIETILHHEFVILRTGDKVFIGRKPDTGKYNTPEIAAAETAEMKKKFGFSKLVPAKDDDWEQDMRVACRKPRK